MSAHLDPTLLKRLWSLTEATLPEDAGCECPQCQKVRVDLRAKTLLWKMTARRLRRRYGP